MKMERIWTMIRMSCQWACLNSEIERWNWKGASQTYMHASCDNLICFYYPEANTERLIRKSIQGNFMKLFKKKKKSQLLSVEVSIFFLENVFVHSLSTALSTWYLTNFNGHRSPLLTNHLLRIFNFPSVPLFPFLNLIFKTFILRSTCFLSKAIFFRYYFLALRRRKFLNLKIDRALKIRLAVRRIDEGSSAISPRPTYFVLLHLCGLVRLALIKLRKISSSAAPYA